MFAPSFYSSFLTFIIAKYQNFDYARLIEKNYFALYFTICEKQIIIKAKNSEEDENDDA
jgi:hypothetical protein